MAEHEKTKSPRRRKPKNKLPVPARSNPTDKFSAHPSVESHEKLTKIAGLQAVSALFRYHPDRVMRLYYEDSLKNQVGGWCTRLAQSHRPYRMVSDIELTRISGTVLHGGVVAAATPLVITDFDLTAAQTCAKQGKTLLIADGIGNPHNLGAIARSMAFFGCLHLIISDHPAQAGLSDAAYRVAEGGLETLTVWRASHLPSLLKKMQRHYQIVGTSLSNQAIPLSQFRCDQRPIAIVLGNEEHGLSVSVSAACETLVKISGGGKIQSLNVSATAAILIYHLSELRFPQP